MAWKNKLLTILSEAEQYALYGLPDFDDTQQLEYLALTESELALAVSRPGFHAQAYCILQIGYFKAKHAFFRFNWNDVEEDFAFVLNRYFNDESFKCRVITKHEHYTQCGHIAKMFGYRLWSSDFLAQLAQQAIQIVQRDVTPGFVATELIVWLNEHKIIRPGYTTLQNLISETLSTERRRIGDILAAVLDENDRAELKQLITRDETISELSVLRQDAKDFRWRQMTRERKKRVKLASLYSIAKGLLPKFGISHQNILYYASLANFYTVYDLRRLRPEQTNLYLLCYAWSRYRQLTDNLVDALSYHMKQLEGQSREAAKKAFYTDQLRKQKETPRIGRLLSLYVDDSVFDTTPFGEIRQRAYKIIPRDTLQNIAKRMIIKPASKLARHWMAVDEMAKRIRIHLRPLFIELDFESSKPDNPWLMALAWAKGIFAQKQRLSQRPITECPTATLPKRLRPYLLVYDANGNPTALHADRYEFWLYRQIRKRVKSGELYLDNSLQHRQFSSELVSIDEKAEVGVCQASCRLN